MSRFIRILKKGDVIVINSDRVEQVGFRLKQEKPTVHLFLIGSGETHLEVEFEIDEDAISFIEKNFILFNA